MLARTLALLLLCSLCVGALSPGEDIPAFSDPTAITNIYSPFQAGSVAIFRGRVDGEKSATLVSHLQATRLIEYPVGSFNEVECAVLEEQEFVAGVLVEISTSYLAQDDTGNVRLFGEISYEYEAGVLLGAEEDSWIVGGATLPSDPPGAVDVSEPAMFMPATLAPGDTFVLQNLPGKVETITVLADELSVKVPAGKFQPAFKLQELDDGEDGTEPPTYRWVVPQVGTVKEKQKGVRSDLIATSVVDEAGG